MAALPGVVHAPPATTVPAQPLVSAALSADGCEALHARQGAPVTVQILELCRFTVTSNFEAITGEVPELECDDCYDAIVSDGTSKAKVMLAPALNGLVRAGVLDALVIVRITRWRLQFNDSLAVASHAMVIVSELAEVSRAVGPIVASDLRHFSLTPYDSASSKMRPLCEVRASYVGLHDVAASPWPRDDPAWTISPPAEWAPDVGSWAPIAAVMATLRPGTGSTTPIVGVVTKIDSLVYYGKRTDTAPWPFALTLVLEDATMRVEVVLWNAVCRRALSSLELGAVLALTQYRVKPSYSDKSRMELSVSSKADASAFVRLPPALAARARHLVPEYVPPLNSLRLQQLRHVPDETIIDFVGVVVYIGRVVRNAYVVDGGARLLRTTLWVGCRDESTARELPVQLTVNTFITESNLRALALGDVIVLTNVRLFSALLGSHTGRYIMCATTTSSAIYGSTGAPHCPFDNERYKALAALDVAEHMQFVSRLSMGYRRWFPHVGESIGEYRRLRPNVAVVPVRQLVASAAALALHEHTTAIVHARVVRIRALRAGPAVLTGVKRKPGAAPAAVKRKRGTGATKAEAGASAAAADAQPDDTVAADDKARPGDPSPAPWVAHVLASADVDAALLGRALAEHSSSCFIPVGLRQPHALPSAPTPCYWELLLADLNSSLVFSAVVYPVFTCASSGPAGEKRSRANATLPSDARGLRHAIVNSFFDLSDLPDATTDEHLAPLTRAIADELAKLSPCFLVVDLYRGQPRAASSATSLAGVEIAISSAHLGELEE